MRTQIRTLLPLAVVALAVNTAGAAPVPIGQAKDVVPAASSMGAGGNATLAPGATVFQDDLVRTGAAGKAGLQFLDETQLEVGPNSSAKLDRFVFNPDKTAAQASISLAKGVFRFVSGGHSRPNSYSITTPHATLGIRGTEIEITVTDVQTDIIVKSGLVNACSRVSNGCRELSPNRQNNAGIFTVTGLVRAYAFRQSDDFPGGNRTAGVGGGGGGGGGSLAPQGLSRGDNDLDNSIRVRGVAVGLGDGVPPGLALGLPGPPNFVPPGPPAFVPPPPASPSRPRPNN